MYGMMVLLAPIHDGSLVHPIMTELILKTVENFNPLAFGMMQFVLMALSVTSVVLQVIFHVCIRIFVAIEVHILIWTLLFASE